MARALHWAVVGMLCWALLPVGLVILMTLINPTYWRPMFSVGGLGLIAVGLIAIGISLVLAAVARKLARPSRGRLLAGLGLILAAFLVQFVTLWVVLIGPALLVILSAPPSSALVDSHGMSKYLETLSGAKSLPLRHP